MSHNDQEKYTGFEAIQPLQHIKDQLGEMDDVASVGVVLGSGLGSVADEVLQHEGSRAIDYGYDTSFSNLFCGGS